MDLKGLDRRTWEIRWWHECGLARRYIEIRHLTEGLAFLRGDARGVYEMADLRDLIARERRGTLFLLDDHEVVDYAARQLAARRLRIVEVGEREELPGATAVRRAAPPRAREEPPAAPPPARPPPRTPPKTWIGVQLLEEDGTPVRDEKYRIELPDGAVMEGTLDAEGRVQFDEIDPGTCKITFPEIDQVPDSGSDS